MDLSFYKNKRVFLTGHTGFKGTWLSRILVSAGADVTGYSLESPTNPSIFEQTDTSSKIRSIIGNICEGEKLKDAMKNAEPDIVLHLAAQPIVRTSYKDPVGTYETNVMGTVNLLQALRQCDSVKSIVVVTTDKVYENKGDGAIYSEEDLLGGGDPYATSKSSMEFIVKAYRESYFQRDGNSVGLATVRASNVLAGGDHVNSRLIPSILNAVSEKKTVELRNPNQTRPWQSVLDALNGYLSVGRLLYSNPKMFIYYTMIFEIIFNII